MTARIHPTAIIESDVTIGSGTVVWDNVHVRGPSTIGRDCIIGEKTYIAYGVEVADLVKINASVYICNGVTIERGVMISAGTVFTNDLYPRATNPELTKLRSSSPDGNTRPTVVREGATIGAHSVIGCDLEIGRFTMIGMGAVVTKSVSDFHLVVGHPARTVGYVCRCGQPTLRLSGDLPADQELSCHRCGRRYYLSGRICRELDARAHGTASVDKIDIGHD